jgi:hypothetical protein
VREGRGQHDIDPYVSKRYMLRWVFKGDGHRDRLLSSKFKMDQKEDGRYD